MDSEQIARRIRSRESELEDVRERLRKARQQEADLQEFRVVHDLATARLDADLTARRSQVDGSSIDATRVRVFSGFKSAFTAILDQSHAHMTVRAEESRSVLRAIDSKQTEIDNLVRQENSLTSTLSDLRSDLRTARRREEAEASGV